MWPWGPVALWLVGMKPCCSCNDRQAPNSPGHQRSPCVVSFFQFAGEFFLHPGALVEDTATVCASPHGGRVSQQANQSVSPGWLCDAGSRGFSRLLSEEPEGLWGYHRRNAEESKPEKTHLVPDPEPLIQLLLKTVPSSASHPIDVLVGVMIQCCASVLAGSMMPVIRLNTRLGVSMKVYYKWNQHLQSTDLFI